nr:immunoglobulin light chain junction region [Macaca mulatta]MOW61682.1 immunoglobulin light chain junction region [Macaca mulatta]MOW62470.1 immunoglobulin light chain junction region [Macaca mulatta]MOW62632.1 immunoglobulin light chain junction region [Macaca mulatta]MOW62638.1 immunoglobulin light chain junction region [Macaca mulatta]
CGQGTHWPPTF